MTVVVSWVSQTKRSMTTSESKFELDLTSAVYRMRLKGAVPSKPVKVLVREAVRESSLRLYGTGVLSEDSSVFIATVPSEEGARTFQFQWRTIQSELETYCQRVQAIIARLPSMPNPSVNLTRNSVPRWPSEARYAHNAPLVQQVTLPRAGYLKR
jgi:hypothetical protein